jgi:hypothetical protein
LSGNSYDGHILAKVVREITWQIGVDNGYDTREFIAELRERGATPHVAQNKSGRRSAIDGRTTRHPVYAISLHPQTDRGGVRLVEIIGAPRQDPLPRPATPALRLHPHRRRLNLVRLPKLLAAA